MQLREVFSKEVLREFFSKETFKNHFLPLIFVTFAGVGAVATIGATAGYVKFVSDVPDCEENQQVDAIIGNQKYELRCKQ